MHLNTKKWIGLKGTKYNIALKLLVDHLLVSVQSGIIFIYYRAYWLTHLATLKHGFAAYTEYFSLFICYSTYWLIHLATLKCRTATCRASFSIHPKRSYFHLLSSLLDDSFGYVEVRDCHMYSIF